MRKIFKLLALVFLINGVTYAQCGDSEICNSNAGLYSNDDAASIAYDNMGSGFHSTFIREPNGSWKVWGEYMSNSGAADVLSPLSVNATNYPQLTGTIYKMGIGSDYLEYVQLVVLTSTGLFVSGSEGAVLDSGLTTSSFFRKVTVNGKADGLPLNVSPADVKMLFVTNFTIIITTCSGEVYVLSQNDEVRGDGGNGDSLYWSKVMQSATQPLTNVIVARGSTNLGFALKADGSIWTWGGKCFLGNGTASSIINYATQMTLPAGLPGVKSIQATADGYSNVSYYILGTDKKVYSLGYNNYGQLGDRTTVNRLSWVNAKNPDASVITDAAWISANEHDPNFPGVAIIKAGGILYTAGANASYMIGRTIDGGVNNPALPTGVTGTDVITYAEVGGHTCALIKQGSPRYGYVGHRVNGSMGDGTSQSGIQQSYDFITPPIVFVCGTLCTQPVVTTNAPICPGQNAVFTITGTPGDIVSYKINSGATQTITISPTGTVTVTVNAPTVDQTISLVYVLGGNGSCSNNLSVSQTITLSGSSATPTFNQVSAICQGQTLNPLPTTSLNGISGTWSPALNNMATTQYTFTPTSSTCGVSTTMTITVLPPGTTPTFTQIAPICEGDALVLPAVSSQGIDGTWSPAVNNSATTAYTFTPNAGTCLNVGQMTVNVTPKTTTVFTQIPAVCSGTSTNPLPNISDNGITGTWSPAFNNTATTTYNFTPSAGICATSTSMTVVVNTLITPTFTQIPPICEGSALTLPTTSDNAVVGIWSPAANNAATTLYTFSPTVGSCYTTAQMTVAVNPKINPIFPSFGTICYGESFSLPLISNNGIHGSWLPQINNTQTTVYNFTPDVGECANGTSSTVAVYNDFDFDYKGYCKDGNFFLEVFPLNQSFDLAASSVVWSSNGVTIGNGPILNVTAYHKSLSAPQMPFVFDISVTNDNECTKNKSVTIDNDFCGIQKGISVNDDNLNDFFDLRLLEVKHLSIFNRFGMKVYEKSNYYNEWKGQSDKGDDLPDGTYYYVIDFKNTGNPSKTGWIYLCREK